MISYYRLRRKPQIFRAFTGISVEEFDEIEEKAHKLWVKATNERLERPDRKRSMGAGRKTAIDYREQILMTFVWLKLYLTFDALGYLFGVSKATAYRYVTPMLGVLREVGEETLGWPEPPKRGHGKNLFEVWEENPDLFAYVDATEQQIERPVDKAKQKETYSGKKKTHTRKTQLVVNEHGVIRHVSKSTKGSMHDRKHFTHSGVSEDVPEGIVVAGDLGYQGIQDDFPETRSVIVPFKKPKGKTLTENELFLNQEFARGRIIVENVICQFKHFGALSQRYRHHIDKYDDVFRSILAIVNPRIKKRLSEQYAT